MRAYAVVLLVWASYANRLALGVQEEVVLDDSHVRNSLSDGSELPQKEEPPSPAYYEPPTISIKGAASPPSSDTRSAEDDGEGLPSWATNWDEQLLFLVDEWWKLAIWIAVLSILLCLCCYCSRCCYLTWDCLTDPFWGCCPRCHFCEGFLLMKRRRNHLNQSLTSTSRRELDLEAELEDARRVTRENFLKPIPDGTDDDHDQAAALISHFGKQQGSKQPKRRSYYRYDEDSAEDGALEAMPQVYDTHYFNLLHLFGFRGGRCQYEVAIDPVEVGNMSDDGEEMLDFTLRSSPRDGTSPNDIQPNATSTNTPANQSGNGSQNRSHSSNNNTSTRSGHGSFQRKNSEQGKINDLVIEHGPVGRWQMLPEAESELIPVHIRDRSYRGGSDQRLSNGFKRKSRSMESFGPRNGASSSRLNGQMHSQASLNSQQQGGGSTAFQKPPMRSQASQTDLHVDTNSQLIVPTSITHSHSPANSVSRSSAKGFPLPKVPPKRESQSQQGSLRGDPNNARPSSTGGGGAGRKSYQGHRRNGSIRSMQDIERNILHGRETVLV